MEQKKSPFHRTVLIAEIDVEYMYICTYVAVQQQFWNAAPDVSTCNPISRK